MTEVNIDKKLDNDIKYAVLMETNGDECESWYYCIKYTGNEEALNYLHKQLESVEMYIIDDYSTFDLDLEHLICEKTAKELTKLELNSIMFHRKFDGKLEMINCGLKKKDSNKKKIIKINKKIGMGDIDNFIDQEDIDPEDLESESELDESDHLNDEELIPMPMGMPANVQIETEPIIIKEKEKKRKKKKKHRR